MPRPVVQRPPVASKVINTHVGDGILARIRPVEPPNCGLKVCLYGQTGTGKTSLACTFPTPLLLIRSAGEARRKSVFKVPGAMTVSPSSQAELQELAEYQRSEKKFQTVVIDHLTEFQDVFLKQVLGVEEVPAQLGWGTVEQGQYGELALYMKEMLRDFLSLNCHIVVIGQEREFNNESASDVLTPYVGVGVTPSVAGYIGPAVDYLIHCYKRAVKIPVKKKIAGKDVTVYEEKIQFCARTGPHPVYNTKFTVPRGTEVPDVIVDPTYAKIAEIIDSGG